MSHSINFRIYVASLSDYNNGIHHGAWFDFDDFSDVDELQEAIDNMLTASPTAAKHGIIAEEWAIHAFEVPYLLIPECINIGELWDIWENVQELEDYEVAPFFLFLENIGGKFPLADDIDNFREAYQGEYDSEEDFAEYIVEETGMLDSLPEHLRYYFDYEKYARDLFIDGYYMLEGHVFLNI